MTPYEHGVKLAVYLFSQAAEAGMPENLRMPRVGGLSVLDARNNIDRKIAPRAPDTAKRLHATLDAVERTHPATRTAQGGIRIYLRPNTRSMYRLNEHIQLGTLDHGTAAHEAGHAADLAAGSPQLYTDSSAHEVLREEVAATRHARDGGYLTPRIAGGTGSYVEKTFPRTRDALDAEISATPSVRAVARRVSAADAAAAKVRRSSSALEDFLRDRGNGYFGTIAQPSQDSLMHLSKSRARHIKYLESRGASHADAVERATAISSLQPRHREPTFAEFLTPGGRDALERAKAMHESRAARAARLQDTTRLIADAKDFTKNPRLLEELSPRGRKLFDTMVNGVGRRLDTHLGSGAGEAATGLVRRLAERVHV